MDGVIGNNEPILFATNGAVDTVAETMRAVILTAMVLMAAGGIYAADGAMEQTTLRVPLTAPGDPVTLKINVLDSNIISP